MALSPRHPGRLRRVAHWMSGGLLAAQLAAAGALVTFTAIKRRSRRPYRFPTAPAEPVSAGRDQVSVFTFGRDLYSQMLADIAAATSTIHFETFIWKSDEVGRQFRQALVDAAARGVKVYAIWDEFANLVVDPRFFHGLTGVHVRPHPLLTLGLPSVRNLGRDHRKLLIVDSRIGYVGGYNIGKTYADRWRDTHARIVGPAVADLENAFVDKWNLRPYASLPSRRRPERLSGPISRSWDTTIEVRRNVPRMAMYPIRNMYLEAIDRASKRIWMTQAYFIPDDDMMAALRSACARGVDVRIIIPAESNHVVADWLSRGYYERLLSCGVHLLLYQGAMVHAKTCTIDGAWTTIGTANIDRLSLQGNYEINISVVGAQVARAMEEIFEIDSRNCTEMDLDRWRRRSVFAKFTEMLLAPWRPLF
ncbi:cardiolipin synthase B [Acidipropionibacterium jensenii]|uniref:Cardiolipin synthase B n=1 Tax=Acidipropionibacterium jensenii TaxID=1749 RepID=A0A3Q9UJH8_9ACTN|nr:phospholipase D-like domain-containing protein [Acidipropionibacterium jensenii]AZZ38977.1 cardiolipin synthase B [Acidipropionibacterium jensenii]